MNTKRIHALETDNQLYFLDNKMKVVATTYKLSGSSIPYISTNDQSWYIRAGSPNYVWAECEISDALMSEYELVKGNWVQDPDLKYRHYRYKVDQDNQIVIAHTVEDKKAVDSLDSASTKYCNENGYEGSSIMKEAFEAGAKWQEDQYKEVMEGNLVSWMLTIALRKLSNEQMKNLADSLYARIPANLKQPRWRRIDHDGHITSDYGVLLTADNRLKEGVVKRMHELAPTVVTHYIPLSELLLLPKE